MAAAGGMWRCRRCRRARRCKQRGRLTRRRNHHRRPLMAHPFDVKIGINPISWSNDDLPSLGGDTSLETALTEGKAIGYRGFELGNKFPREPEALRRLMAGYGLEVISGWYSGRLAQRTVAQEIDAVQTHLKLLT